MILASLYLMRKGIRGIDKINDFDVIRHGVVQALKRTPELYFVDSREGRHYLYPPSSLVPLLPVGLLPYKIGGYLFTLGRLFALAAIFHIAVKWTGETVPLEESRTPWLMVGAFFVCFRFLNNEFGNGQINLYLAALCFGGSWLALRPGRKQEWLGGLLVGLAASVKATPLIFIGVFILHKRWKALAFSLLLLILITALTHAWLGADLHEKLWKDWRTRGDWMALGSTKDDKAISLPEFIGTILNAGGVSLDRGGVKILWLVEAAIFLIAGLSIRFLKFRKSGFSPLWDTILIGVSMVMLSPMTRKAHMAVILFPVLVSLLIVYGHRNLVQGGKAIVLLWTSLVLIFLGVSLSFEKVIPSYEVNITIFTGLLLFLLCLSGLKSETFQEKRL